MEKESLLSGNTILSILLGAIDPETGQKFTFNELLANLNTLL
jgi:hypothetical protein